MTGERKHARHRGRDARRLDHHVEAASFRQLGRLLGDVARSGVESLSRTDLQPERATMGLRLDEGHRRSHRGRRHRAEKADRPAADNGHVVACVDPVGGDSGVVRHRKRLDERAVAEGQLVGDAVQPRRLRDEVLRIRPADREAEMVVTVVNDAFADDTVTLPEGGHSAPDLGDLARPLVSGDDRVVDGDDVAPLVELEVGVADPDVSRANQHLVGRDRRYLEVAHDCAARLLEHERFHSGLLTVRPAP